MIYKLHPLVEPGINFIGTFLGALLAALVAIIVMNKQISYDKNKAKVNELERFIKEYIELSGITNGIIELLDDTVNNIDNYIRQEDYRIIKANITLINMKNEEIKITEKDHIPLEIYRDFVGIKYLISIVTSLMDDYFVTNKVEYKQELIQETERIKNAINRFNDFGMKQEEELSKLKGKL